MKRRVVAIVFLAGVIGVLVLCGGVIGILHIVPGVLGPGIDMTGGTILTYEIDTQGLSDEEKKGLSLRMINLMRRRVDPRGNLSLLWRPLDDTHLEILMPPVHPETRQKRQAFEAALAELFAKNVKTSAERGGVVEGLAKPDTGRNPQFEAARSQLHRLKLTLTTRQVEFILEMRSSPERATRIAQLKNDFPDRAQLIDKVVTAYDEYRPFRGQLDDPKDLQQLLQNMGVLEFRVLPTREHPQVDAGQVEHCLATLEEKGPQGAPGDKYVWCEIENPQEWHGMNAITAAFDGRYYVLASNDPNETMLQHTGKGGWGLKKATPATDGVGRRAIGFELDTQGGSLFYSLTSRNGDRPLAIIIDDKVISAPNVTSPIRDRGIIVGSFTPTQVSDMVNWLNAGALPARLVRPPLSIKTIGRADDTEKNAGEGTVSTTEPNDTK